ncbi:PspC domain-containing protein [Flavobacteriaceae bacterium F08102]|nr:PspC domain-containing protein [Flavobacteriaceae bacterium F08102]
MNKTVNINLGGTFFHIDELAYQKLKKYLDAVRKSLNDDPQGVDEIINDIEARISELLSDKVKNVRQVVSDQDIDEIISVMGQPEDYQIDEEIFNEQPKRTTYQSRKRKLYRDPDDKFIGGVASGLAHYFDVDVVWIRIGWLIATFGLGFGFLVYIILWIVVPEANTTAEKLEMQGEEVNISNIEKKIRNDFDYAKEHLSQAVQDVGDALKDGYENVTSSLKKKERRRSRSRSGIRHFIEGLGTLISTFFMIFGKFIGIVLIIAAIGSLVTLTISLFTASTFEFWEINELFDGRIQLANITDIPMWLVSLILLFLVGIPLLSLFFLGLSILSSKDRIISRTTKFAMLGVWLIALFSTIFLTTKEIAEFAKEGTVVDKQELTLSPRDTLMIKMRFNDEYSTSINRWDNTVFKTVLDGDKERQYANKVRFSTEVADDNVVTIKIQKSAHGRSITKARAIADEMTYTFDVSDNLILLDNYFLTSAKFRNQDVRITLYLPKSYLIKLDMNTKYYLGYSRNTSNLYRSSLAGHVFRMTEKGLSCLDCVEDLDEESSREDLKNDEPKSTNKNRNKVADAVSNNTPPQPKIEKDTLKK